MRTTNDIFIAIPKPRNAQIKIEINGDDVTSRVIESKWTKQLLSLGVGNFMCRLSNAGGQLTDKYVGGHVVKFIADNSTKTREQFVGRIDYPREILEKEGQYLEIIGRQRAFFLSELKVCHSATNTDCAVILKDICEKEAPSLDVSEIPATTGVTTDVEWDYKNFTECVKELMEKSGYDCVVDNDLKVKFFEANSILNEDEAIAENDNFLETQEIGQDNYYERTRVTVAGQDDKGIPIVYTAISGIDDDETDRETEFGSVREVFQKETSANTMDKVEKLAVALLNQYTNRPSQGKFKSMGLETLEPGENLWVVVARQKIYGQYKAVQVIHTFGSKMGGWRTETGLESEIQNSENIIQGVISKTENLSVATNPNKMNYSYNVDFNSDDFTTSHTRTQISEGKLVLTNESYNDGTWVSITKTAPKTITEVELKIDGKDLRGSVFEFSLNNGVTYQTITKDTLTNPNHAGRQIKLRVKLVRSYFATGPELDSVALLYK